MASSLVKLIMFRGVFVRESRALGMNQNVVISLNSRWLSSSRSSEGDKHKSSSEATADDESTPHQEEVIDPYLPPWPRGVNPHTGERGGPRGPEPTRYGDWERKGRVSDF
jgi:hypothetical protein